MLSYVRKRHINMTLTVFRETFKNAKLFGEFNMFNIVNKTTVLQYKIKNMINFQYDKDNTNLYIYYT